MWIPTIISSSIIFLATIILIVFEKIKKVEENTRIYRIVAFLGVYVPVLIIGVNYSYMKTDTLKETILVSSAMCICISILFLYLQIGVKHRYSYILYLIVILSFYFIYNCIKPFMLSGFWRGFLPGIVGSIFGSSIHHSNHKVKFIISGVIVFLIIIIVTVPSNRKWGVENSSKVETVAKKYVENKGYDISSEDLVLILGESVRDKPIKLWIYRKEFSENFKFKRKFDLIYNNGQIINFKEDI